MDTGEGKFVFANNDDDKKELEFEYPDHGEWFRVGETVSVKGSIFRVKAVKPNGLRLKLLAKSKQVR